MPTRHQGGFLWSALQILPSFRHTDKSMFSKPFQAHRLMRLRDGTFTPQSLAAQHTDPGLVLLNSVANIELIDCIPSLQLFQLNSSKFTAYPAVHLSKEPVTADMPVVIRPASQQHIEPVNLFLKAAWTVTTGKIPYLVLKTADTLQGYSKPAVVETGDSQESFFRLHGQPPISPY